MRYEYRNSKGETRIIIASMKKPPPDAVLFGPDDEWRPAKKPNAKGVFRRVYGHPEINMQAIGSKWPVVSSTLPHRLPGCRTDRYGRSIVENKKHADYLCKKYGYVRDGF